MLVLLSVSVRQAGVDDSLLELRREASCAAYNALTTVICKTQKQEKFYAALCFKEAPGKVSCVFVSE